MLAAPVVIVLTLASTTNLVLSCSPSSDITEVQDIRLCNGSTLSIKLNVSDSCSNIIANLYVYLYHHNTSSGGTARSHVSWEYFNYSDVLCGVTARLDNPVIINVDEFNRINLLQIRLRELSGNEICSNNFHVFLDDTGFLGPPVNINSNSYNCSTINVTWSEPDVNCGNHPVKYNLSIYDDITDQFLWSVSVDGTSYQFQDEHLFRHRYTYVISAYNDLSEGISINDTFSYQRVPKSAMEHTTLDVLNYTRDMATVEYNIPVTLECTGEAPENATVTIECTGTGIIYDDTELIEYEQPNNITGLISVPQYEHCILNVTFSNGNGSSEPFILAFNTTPPLPPYISSSLPTVSKTPTLGPVTDPPGMTMGAIIGIVVGIIAVVILALILVLVAVVVANHKKKNGSNQWRSSATDSNDVELKEVKQRDENDKVEEELVQDGGPVHVQALDDAAGQGEIQVQDDDDVRQKGSEQDDGGLGQKEVIQNGREEKVQEGVIQNPVAELKDVVQDGTTENDTVVRQEQGDGAVEQGIARTGVLVDNTTSKSKSNDKETESADNARDSKKPTKKKHHADTYDSDRHLLSSSVAETNVDESESYYDVPEVTDEAGGIFKATTDDDQQQQRKYVVPQSSIPRPTAGDNPSAMFSATLYGAPVLTELLKVSGPQASTQEIPSLKKESST